MSEEIIRISIPGIYYDPLLEILELAINYYEMVAKECSNNTKVKEQLIHTISIRDFVRLVDKADIEIRNPDVYYFNEVLEDAMDEKHFFCDDKQVKLAKEIYENSTYEYR